MKRFVVKILLFCFPLIVPILLFILIDPFMIIGDNRGDINFTSDYTVTSNRDFQSTELFLKNNEEQNYNSFILGNSRSIFYSVDTWKRYIDGNCFHFNSSNETLFGIERKLAFLDKKDVPIKNVLLILDYGTLIKTSNSEGHLFIKHPQTSGESLINFYTVMFKGFIIKPMLAHIDLFMTGKRKNYMKDYGINENLWNHNPTNNQLSYFVFDSILNINENLYYEGKEKYFYPRDAEQSYSEAAIEDEQKELLTEIKSILNSQNTNYKIIINPLYDQVKMNKRDLVYLNNLFGLDKVFDYSGQNNFTNDYRNYYEPSHYRPKVANQIMSELYKRK